MPTPFQREAVYVQRDDNNQYYEQINFSGSDAIVYFTSSGHLQIEKISDWASRYGFGTGGITASTAYNGNRPITRDDPDFYGQNVGGTTVTEFLDNFFFPFLAPTITINSSTLIYETGSSQNISLNGTITDNDATVFGTGSIKRSGFELYSFAKAPTYSTTDTGLTASVTYTSYLQAENAESEAIIVNSATKTVTFLYPYLWGVSDTPGLTGTALYSALTATAESQGNKTKSMIGTGKYIYFCYPSSYPDLVSILDPNSFEVISSFEFSSSIAVQSSGLTYDWERQYKVYRLKYLADPNGDFQFIY